jgi:putative transposase
MANDAEGFSTLEDGVWSFQSLEQKRGMGKRAGQAQWGISGVSKKRVAPSYGIIDSQSVKTIYASEERGIDGGKKVKGRKRHIIVDTLGNLLHVSVHKANEHDTKAGVAVFERVAEKYRTIKAFSGDAGYRGTSVTFVQDALQLKLNISTKIKDVFAVLPIRWIVERTFAWLGGFRRLAKDVEILTATAENMIRIAMLRLTLAKLR